MIIPNRKQHPKTIMISTGKALVDISMGKIIPVLSDARRNTKHTRKISFLFGKCSGVNIDIIYPQR